MRDPKNNAVTALSLTDVSGYDLAFAEIISRTVLILTAKLLSQSFIIADTLPNKIAILKEIGQGSMDLGNGNMVKSLGNLFGRLPQPLMIDHDILDIHSRFCDTRALFAGPILPDFNILLCFYVHTVIIW